MDAEGVVLRQVGQGPLHRAFVAGDLADERGAVLEDDHLAALPQAVDLVGIQVTTAVKIDDRDLRDHDSPFAAVDVDGESAPVHVPNQTRDPFTSRGDHGALLGRGRNRDRQRCGDDKSFEEMACVHDVPEYRATPRRLLRAIAHPAATGSASAGTRAAAGLRPLHVPARASRAGSSHALAMPGGSARIPCAPEAQSSRDGAIWRNLALVRKGVGIHNR